MPIESQYVGICWFQDSEQIVVVYQNKFQICNVLTPEKSILSIDSDLLSDFEPKVFLNYSIIALINKDKQMIFYDLKRQKFIA